MKPFLFAALAYFCLHLIGCGGGGDSQPEILPVEPTPPEEPQPNDLPVLRWNAPTTRTDHTPLQSWEIAKYQIWYGQDRYHLELLEEVPGGDDSPELVVDMLNEGYYFFAVTVVDSDNLASDRSVVILKKVPDDLLSSGNDDGTTTVN